MAAGHQYNSVEFEVRRSFAKGLSYDFSYVVARDIGDLERGQSPEGAYNRGRDRAVWRDIPTHRITSYMVYELPFGKGKPLLSNAGRAANAFIGGWYFTAIYILHSGNFLTPQWSGPDPTGTAYTTNSTPAQVTIRPNCIANPNVLSGSQTVNRWFNAAAFTAPTLGSFGSCAKGVIKGPPGYWLHRPLVQRRTSGGRPQATSGVRSPDLIVPVRNELNRTGRYGNV